MSLAILNLYNGLEVGKLPKLLQEEIYPGFELFDRDTIAEAPIQTWRDFLMSSTLQEGIENSRYWLDTLAEAKVKEEAEDNLFIVQVNVLDLPDAAYETHHKYKNLAIVDFGLPMLICDAEEDYFGLGYIVIEIAEDGGGAWLACDLMTYEDIQKWVREEDKRC